MSALQPPGDKMKKVLCWVSEYLQEHPKKKRADAFKEAEIRFDLSPLECEFLDKHFSKDLSPCR
ncbi:MAG: hypothetical protein KQH63_21875 [Desulfobulbaceae bacterium]|nr:hypothetical protein [Desulfobulbaceae bacterium]